jgi:hypothetical protein
MVLQHRGARSLRVTVDDGPRDGLVPCHLLGGAVAPQPGWDRSRLDPVLVLVRQYGGVDALVHRAEIGVVRAADDGRVEDRVLGDPFGGIAGRLAEPLKRGEYPVGFLPAQRGLPCRGMLDAEGLEPEPQLHQVVYGVFVEIEHEVDRSRHHRLRTAQHIGSRAPADLDQAHQRQGPQRLADRGPTGTEPLRQVPFGWQPGTLGDILADDQAADLVGQVVRHPGRCQGNDAREVDRLRALP